MLKPFDDHNKAVFKNDRCIGYICCMCGCYCDRDECISFKGYNLVCDKCVEKLTSVFDTNTSALREQIQHVGKRRLESNEVNE